MRARIPMYAAGLAATCVGVAALNTAMANNRASVLMCTLMACGFAVSWMFRAGVIERRVVHLATLLILVSALAVLAVMPEVRYHLLPADIADSADLLLATMLAWLMVIYSFNLATDRSVLFICVPSLSLVGLVATFGSNGLILLYFSILVTVGSFALMQENSLSESTRPSKAKDRGRRDTARLYTHVAVALGVGACAYSIGLFSGRVVYPIFDKTITDRLLAPTAEPILQHFAEMDYVPVASGPVALSDQEVMIVRCKEPLLWRGQTFDLYLGQGWSSSIKQREEIVIHAEVSGRRTRRLPPGLTLPRGRFNTFEIPPDINGETRASVKRVEQSYLQVLAVRSNTIFAAAEPERVSFNVTGPIIRSGGGLRTNSFYMGTAFYKVTSLVSTATPAQLRKAGNEYPEEILAHYTETPQSAWQVEKLAKRITAGRTNAYDKAIAIQRYLETHYTYDLNAPAVPRGEDAVTYFMLKSKRGYCDIFASAMAIMARQVGIPARWVTGFATGEPNPVEGTYHVRAKDAHAWAELYFPGYGWIAFDPAPQSDAANFAERIRRAWAAFTNAMPTDAPSVVLVCLIVLLLGYLVKVELLDRVRVRRERSACMPNALATEAASHYHRMCNALARAGYPRHKSVTPLEYMTGLESQIGSDMPEVVSAVESVTETYIRCRYAGRQLSREELAQMGSAARSAIRLIKNGRKRTAHR